MAFDSNNKSDSDRSRYQPQKEERYYERNSERDSFNKKDKDSKNRNYSKWSHKKKSNRWNWNKDKDRETPNERPTRPSNPNTPSTPTLPRTEYVKALEQEILKRTNEERDRAGLSKLDSDNKLADIARAHSVDMAEERYFEHVNLEGCDPACRARNAGYNYRSIGENLYMMSGYTLTPAQAAERVVNGWMDSPGHRANILRGTYTHSGVGVAVVGNSIYATSLYSLPR